jgi:hypothetical protein
VRKVSLSGVVIAAVLACTAGCKDDVTQVPGAPTPAHYQISFPSTAAAVGADTVQVTVFDVPAADASRTGEDASCLTLITKVKSNADLPKAPTRLAQTDLVSVCSLLTASGDAGATPGRLGDISYGRRAFLATTKRGTADYFVGCVEATVSSRDFTVDIPVLPVNETTLPPTTTCATLGEKCAGSCK